ncbi:MAG TPA: MBOAT family O-acyltransferase [Bacteroidia bacterium]|nr:MBOAT family O-acyltransferase [Bacteroidia bacterium]
MLFNSIEFLIFFPVVTTLYFLLAHRFRWMLLLGASCYFYMAFVPVYILILGGTILIDYFAGIWIEKAEGKRKKVFLVASLISNIGVLAFFKYYNFLNENLTVLLHGAGYENPIPYLSILLPIGLSFHTFQAMSYTIEVYRGRQQAEKHFGIYALYVMFYPQLVAGPIERPQNVLPQLHEKKYFNYNDVSSGLKLMAWGLFKKVVIADRLALMVNYVYDDPRHFEGLPLIIATIFFAFQIFCDFSGYSDIAIGSARVMGIKLMTNFDRPYSSRSISEFWSRWHISLSSWFRDYLYIPLGGNRVSIPRWYFNLVLVFLISGLWHGANWTFIAWGLLHGLYIVISFMLAPVRKLFTVKSNLAPYSRKLSVLVTFILVCVAWIFFRAQTLSDALYILTHSWRHLDTDMQKIFADEESRKNLLFLGQNLKTFVIAIASIIFLEAVHKVQSVFPIPKAFSTRPLIVRWAVYSLFILTIIQLGIFEENQFIYFQF